MFIFISTKKREILSSKGEAPIGEPRYGRRAGPQLSLRGRVYAKYRLNSAVEDRTSRF